MSRNQERLTFVAPEKLYMLRGFHAASGISSTRMRQAKWLGIYCPMLDVGKRKFMRGLDAIRFIEHLAKSGQVP